VIRGHKNSGYDGAMTREQSVNARGRQTRVLEGGAGQALVLLHAFPLSADMWRAQIDRAPEGWRLVAPDLRGFGAGAAPEGPRTVDDYAADVLALMDTLSIDRAVIGGLSMGGYVTFAMFRLAPERFAGVVLANTKAPGDTEEGRAARRAMSGTVRTAGVRAVAETLLPRLVGETTRRERPAVMERVRAMMESNSAAAIDAAIHALMNRPDSTPALGRITCPALVIAGQEDSLTPLSDAELLASSIGGAELAVLPRAGHLSNVEAPDLFSDALAGFLSRAF
jgi:pimeloyl-ACP methyl ester carboxylesterase